jgi:predicted flap endonuclease-1-like 5' DNA nuclease
MWQIASQMFLCLLLAGVIGAVAGWAVATLMGRGQADRLEEARTRLASVEHDLAASARRGNDAETERARLAADLEAALARNQDLELRKRGVEERLLSAEAGLRVVRERGESAEEALRTALTRASGAETAARECGILLEGAESRERSEMARAAGAEEALRVLEIRMAEELRQLRSERELLEMNLRSALDRLDGLRAELDGSRERLASLDLEAEETAALERRLRQSQERLALLEASHHALEGERDGAEARAQSLEGALREGDGEREEVEARLQGLEVRLRAEQEAHQQSQIRVLELTRLLEAGRRPLGQGTLGLHDARRPRRDDLKEIVGVGPVLERLLHRHGVHSFRQVALWTIDDVRRIDSLLHEFHGRIRRDHWVRQAKTLHRRHHGELLDSPPPGGPDDGDPLRPSP